MVPVAESKGGADGAGAAWPGAVPRGWSYDRGRGGWRGCRVDEGGFGVQGHGRGRRTVGSGAVSVTGKVTEGFGGRPGEGAILRTEV